jgi:tetratricopeptide (TPR) repeat protein
MKQPLAKFYPLIVFVLALVLYSNTIPNEYNLDDVLVTNNHRNTAKGLSAWKEILNEFYYEDDMGYRYGYRPVTHLSFALEHQLFGESPHISHVVNVLLYALLCLFIFYLIQSLDPVRGPTLAFLVAVIFAVHPIHTEVVASIKNRDELLSLLFAVLSLWSVLQLKKHITFFKSAFWLLVSFICFVLSFYAKKSGISLVLLLPFLAIFNTDLQLIPRGKLKGLSLFFALFAFLAANGMISWPLVWIAVILAVGMLNVEILVVVFKRIQNHLLSPYALIPLILVAAYMGAIYQTPDVAIILLLLFSYRIKVEQKPFGSAWLVGILYLIVLVLASFLTGLDNGIADLWPIMGIALPVGLTMLGLWKNSWLILIPSIGVLSNLNGQDLPLAICYLILILILVHNKGYMLWLKPVIRFLPRILLVLATIVLFQKMINYSNEEFVQAGDAAVQTFSQTELFEITNHAEGTDRQVSFIENPLMNHWDLSHRLTFAYHTVGFYLKKMIFPYPLLYYYGYNQIDFINSSLSLKLVDILLVLLSTILLLYAAWRKKYLVLFAGLLTFVSLAAYANFLTPVAGIVGERLAFTASLGMSMLGGLLVHQFLSVSKYPIVTKVTFLVLILSSVALVWTRNRQWKDELSLMKHDMPYLENSAQANALLGNTYMNSLGAPTSGNIFLLDSAVIYYTKAVSLYPQFFNWHYNLGRIYLEKGETAKAKSAFLEALTIDSVYSETHRYLLNIALMESNPQDVLAYSKKLLEYTPQDIQLMLHLSAGYYFTQDFDSVLDVNKRIIAIDSAVAEAHLNMAYAHIALENMDQAYLCFLKGQSLNPGLRDVEVLADMLKIN